MSKVYIEKSKIHNKGILAAKFIRKGETIFIIKGEIKRYSEQTLPKNPQAGPNWVGIKKMYGLIQDIHLILSIILVIRVRVLREKLWLWH